ncbi:MAG: flagellar filament capping protein FliD [Bacillota bacterium]|jgi:flagellar hook-associated protein 2
MAINIYGYPAVNPLTFWAGLFGAQTPNPLSSAVQTTAFQQLLASQFTAQRQTLLAQALTGLQNYGRQLYEAANPLTPSNTTNVFTQRTATSSAADVLTAKALPNATIASHKITVTQLATAQQNLGAALTSTGASVVTPGTNTFTLTVGGTTYNFSVDILSTDTNQTALEKIANATNAANAGVTAAVVTDTAAGTSRIGLTADRTGTNSAFSLADVTGNAVTATSANTVNVAAANAQYTVNGVSYTSQSNTVLLDQEHLTVNLLKTSTAEVTLTVGPDIQAITGAVNNLVNAYSTLASFISQNATLLSPRLGQALNQAYTIKKPDLAALGITAGPDGTLTVDQTKLTAAIQNNLGLVQSAFGGANGFAVNLKFLGQKITQSPLWTFTTPEISQAAFSPNTYFYLVVLNQSRVTGTLFSPGNLVNLLV